MIDKVGFLAKLTDKMNGYEFSSVAGDWVGAFATFAAAVVALCMGLKKEIRDWWFPVKIHLEWERRPPYQQVVQMNPGHSKPEQVMFRFRLINNGQTMLIRFRDI